MKSIEYEESFNNHCSLVNYGAFIILDVLKLNMITGVFFLSSNLVMGTDAQIGDN